MLGDVFSGEFNVSGYHNEVLELENKEGSFWGIDQCLRIQDESDDFHSNLFHMGIYATSQDLDNEFQNPFGDSRFQNFQKEILSQFFELIAEFNIKGEALEATYFAGGLVGNSHGRDSALDKTYEFKEDTISKEFLKAQDVKTFPINTLANIDIHPIEGSLVGVRNEIAYKGIEIATIVFDFFKIKNTHLVPINYIGGYAIGIERLFALLNDSTIPESIPRYTEALKEIYKKYPGTKSILLRDEVLQIIYGQETLHALKNLDLSEGQSKLLRTYKNNLKRVELELS